eukprot:COSAG06_NODE_56238_length_285_cov_2.225806_1_plen_27_part_10
MGPTVQNVVHECPERVVQCIEYDAYYC